MYLWVNIFKIQLSIWVIGSHYSSNANDYTQSNKWYNIFVPQPLMGIGIGAVSLFMLFSSFFFYNTFQKMYKLETKDFLKQFFMHWFKRYWQLRSVMIVQSLGYQQFLYILFNGGVGRDVYFNGLRDWKYWVHLYFPFFWYDRVWHINKYISESSWFNLELINIEFFQYLYHFIAYFIQKRINIKIVSIIQIAMGLTLYFTGLTGASSVSYSIGYVVFQLKELVMKKNIQIKHKKIFFFILLYLHELLGRGCFILNFIPMSLIMIFDITPSIQEEQLPLKEHTSKKEFNLIELFMKIQPSLYISHHPFLREAKPKYFDYMISSQFSLYIGYLIIPYVVLQSIILSIPLYIIQLPIFQMNEYIFKNKDGKRKKISVRDVICICVFVVLLGIQISDAFGHVAIPVPQLWENRCELLLCFTKTIKFT